MSLLWANLLYQALNFPPFGCVRGGLLHRFSSRTYCLVLMFLCILSPAHTDSAHHHMTCFRQWDTGKCAASRGLVSAYMLGLVLLAPSCTRKANQTHLFGEKLLRPLAQRSQAMPMLQLSSIPSPFPAEYKHTGDSGL